MYPKGTSGGLDADTLHGLGLSDMPALADSIHMF
jgi:hypothetical protein